jgi:hypothetical protein
MSSSNGDNTAMKNVTHYDAPPPHRSGCLVALLIGLGIILLLPGVCALVFVSSDPKGMLTDSTGLSLVIACMAVAAGGAALIWLAVRRPSR